MIGKVEINDIFCVLSLGNQTVGKMQCVVDSTFSLTCSKIAILDNQIATCNVISAALPFPTDRPKMKRCTSK